MMPRPPCARAEALPGITDYAGPGAEAKVDCDGIVRLAADLLGAPMALLTLRDRATGDGMRLKALVGLRPEDAAAGATAFHAHAMGAAAGAPLIVPDAGTDNRFAASPLVAGPPGVRFCVGVPLIGHKGAAVGALSVFDTGPRAALRDGQADHLGLLARMAVQRLDYARLQAVATASSQIAASTSDATFGA